MSILFGHPTGNPNSHNAALAHYESGHLEAFCVPWMPSAFALDVLKGIAPMRSIAQRLSRRRFEPLSRAPKILGRTGEFGRMLHRAIGGGGESLSYEANDWLMRIMRHECSRKSVTVVHSYEDCSLWQFEEARRRGKACVYDMPIGYYPAWEGTQMELAKTYAAWLPGGGLPSAFHVRPRQKLREMELADLVLAPSAFVENSIRKFHPDKAIKRAVYGVNLDFWHPPHNRTQSGPLRFIYAGQLSIRKGIPLLLDAWEKAGLGDAELQLVGAWHLADRKRAALPRGVSHLPPCSWEELRGRFHLADVFLFPSFFEGFALAILEAMACGLPVAASTVIDRDILPEDCGRLMPIGELDSLVDCLAWFYRNRDRLPAMGRASRAKAETFTWEDYRRCVTAAVGPLV